MKREILAIIVCPCGADFSIPEAAHTNNKSCPNCNRAYTMSKGSTRLVNGKVVDG